MADPGIEVRCKLTDCAYYRQDAHQIVYCHHADKIHYMDARPCPLYRMNWNARQGQAAQDYLKIFMKK